jgi:ribonuclease Z
MEPRKVFWKKNYLIKNSPGWEICGYSRSSFRTGFYINGLNIMLDAGPLCFKKPDHIFITHSHADHIANLPLTLIGDENGNHVTNIYFPKKASLKIQKYISSMFEANALCDDIPMNEWFNFIDINDDNEKLKINSNKNNLEIEIIKCDHKIPTVSYGFGLKKIN